MISDRLAQHYYLKALQLSASAEDHLTYATTLRGMSAMAVDLGHNKQALDLASSACDASPQAGPPAWPPLNEPPPRAAVPQQPHLDHGAA